jgi:hypothetical protein
MHQPSQLERQLARRCVSAWFSVEFPVVSRMQELAAKSDVQYMAGSVTESSVRVFAQ